MAAGRSRPTAIGPVHEFVRGDMNQATYDDLARLERNVMLDRMPTLDAASETLPDAARSPQSDVLSSGRSYRNLMRAGFRLAHVPDAFGEA